MVQQTTAALSRALSVADVTRVLTGTGGARRFGADALILGLVDNDRFEVIAITGLPGTTPEDMMASRLDDTLPLSDAALSRRAAFLVVAR
ncbi:SpoIIE family protein phosphatase OS=Streptomyces rimosus subsp. rimosus (strain ATCC / DSM 40260 / JCM 4667 / NRRL 2234) OX=1265868 GN=SRIM_035220 PE=4 SV=1 [Streptomyces rimosus subsp. rimosus]